MLEPEELTKIEYEEWMDALNERAGEKEREKEKKEDRERYKE